MERKLIELKRRRKQDTQEIKNRNECLIREFQKEIQGLQQALAEITIMMVGSE